jgi:hypothetical protein
VAIRNARQIATSLLVSFHGDGDDKKAEKNLSNSLSSGFSLASNYRQLSKSSSFPFAENAAFT